MSIKISIAILLLVGIVILFDIAYQLRAKLFGWTQGSIEAAERECGTNGFVIKTFGSYITGGWGVFYRVES